MRLTTREPRSTDPRVCSCGTSTNQQPTAPLLPCCQPLLPKFERCRGARAPSWTPPIPQHFLLVRPTMTQLRHHPAASYSPPRSRPASSKFALPFPASNHLTCPLFLNHQHLQVWSIPAALLALRCAQAPDPRSVSAGSFEQWAVLRPTVPPPAESRCAVVLDRLIPRQSQILMSISFDAVCTCVTWSMCGKGPCEAALLIAGFFDGTAKSFRLSNTHREHVKDASNSSVVSALAVPDDAHFAHTATFINPSRQEAVAFVAARPTSDGSAAVMALGIMGGRSLFSTATTCMTDLQSWFHRQSPQDFLYPSALLWPDSTRTLLISDCEFCSVEEIDALTGEYSFRRHTLFHAHLFPLFTGHPRQSIFSMPNHHWPMDMAYSDADYFGTKEDRAALFVAGSDGGIYLAPLFVCTALLLTMNFPHFNCVAP